MSALANILQTFRTAAVTEREKGTYFEKLVKVYLRQEPFYADLYGGKVWLWEDWRKEWKARGNPDPGVDIGIDLVAETTDGDLHAIQAKFYESNAKLTMESFGGFFVASGKKHFTHRLIIHTTTDSTNHLKNALADQHPPVNLISLYDLENSKIDWSAYQPGAENVLLQPGKELRDYQTKAIENVLAGLKLADRGKLIMACGTGKTFTALRLAEQVAGAGGCVLFLVPSLNLLSQTLTDWTHEAAIPLHSYAVCSDSEIGKKRTNPADDYEMLAHELQYPATTDARMLAQAFSHGDDGLHQRAVFSTYHSIEVISRAQKEFGLPEFDLILCDEAHRTTGASFADTDESAFVKIHDQGFLKGKKRVYMTATPRVYGTPAKVKAEGESVVLYSMDDEAYYGKTLHTLSFSEAVNDLKILCDYKVIVLTVSEAHISRSLQRLLADDSNSINVNDAAKIVGCWRALSKMDSQDDLAFDPDPMRRAVAFAQVIEVQKGGRTHKVSSKNIAGMFGQVVTEYRAELLKENPENPDAISRLKCEADHVDGGMGAAEKNHKLDWLKADVPDETCRILSNVRCLSEGVDVPALDAVLFLTPRNSQVDVVQSVGRVMRKPREGNKKLGYVILPVVIPADRSPDEALNDNQTYRVVWEVLQALRSHDDRFDAMINRMQFDGQDRAKMEVIAITDKFSAPRKETATERKAKSHDGKKTHGLGQAMAGTAAETQTSMEFEIGDIERAICEIACNTDPLRAVFASNPDPSALCVSISPFGHIWPGRGLGDDVCGRDRRYPARLFRAAPAD
jgi:predicted helicase